MATRAQIIEKLSVLPTDELLSLLRDETIVEIFDSAARCLNNSRTTMSDTSPKVVMEHANETDLDMKVDKAKRPLNAFMAFRCYYLKIFPEFQQKTASGFLTTLWNKEPSRNKWALIAKVYSFVRDEVGKHRVSLSTFLSIACPIMRVGDPAIYLESLGWTVEEVNDGAKKLVQNLNHAAAGELYARTTPAPTSETELLIMLVQHGYMPEQGHDLVDKMSTNNNAIMTTTATGQIQLSSTSELLENLESHPSLSISEESASFEPTYDGLAFTALSQNSDQSHRFDIIETSTTKTSLLDANEYYNYASNYSELLSGTEPILQVDTLPENVPFDIDNPWHLDMILGFSQQEGDRSQQSAPAARYDPRQDFHYMF